MAQSLQSFWNSFKRKELNSASDDEPLQKSIRARHLVLISLGTGIGTGLLVGNGQVLAKSGPAGLVIGYAVASVMVYLVVQAAGELGVCYANLTGNYTRYPSILVDPALGFAISWVYTLQWMVVLPLQLVSAAITISYWTTTVNPDVFVAIVFVCVIVINLFGARGYAEAEFFCNVCKILMLIGFIILGIIIICGGAGNDGYIGIQYWHNPGSFANGFKGVCSVFCYAGFSYGGVELLVLTASEQKTPRKSIPNACRQIILRILFIYMLTTILICFLVPYNSPQLMGAMEGSTENDSEGIDSSSGSHNSPFVIAVTMHGVKVVPHFINAVILMSVISVANSALYSAPRSLLSLSEQKQAPSFLNYVDRNGRPLICSLVAILFGLLGFVAADSRAREDVFTWLLAISGLSQIFIWMSICVSHIRFRDAMHKQSRSLDEIGYKAQTGYYGSYAALCIALFILVCQFWVAIAPVGMNGQLSAKVFFQNYMAFPIVLAAYLGYKIRHGQWWVCISAEKIDLDSHREVYQEEEEEETKESSSCSSVTEEVEKSPTTKNRAP